MWTKTPNFQTSRVSATPDVLLRFVLASPFSFPRTFELISHLSLQHPFSHLNPASYFYPGPHINHSPTSVFVSSSFFIVRSPYVYKPLPPSYPDVTLYVFRVLTASSSHLISLHGHIFSLFPLFFPWPTSSCQFLVLIHVMTSLIHISSSVLLLSASYPLMSSRFEFPNIFRFSFSSTFPRLCYLDITPHLYQLPISSSVLSIDPSIPRQPPNILESLMASSQHPSVPQNILPTSFYLSPSSQRP